MCFENTDEIVPYDEGIDSRDCCKCWYYNYYDKFHIFPGIRCTCQALEDCLEGEHDTSYPDSQCCCNTNSQVEPPCTWLSACICPIAMVFDIITCPIRGCIYKCRRHKENKRNRKIEISFKDGSEPSIDTQPTQLVSIQPQ